MPRTLIITPTYNEAENLPRFVKAVRSSLPDADLLVVDDGSPDGTGEIADALGAGDPHVRVMHRPGKLGLGTAYVEAFKKGLGLLVSTPFEQLSIKDDIIGSVLVRSSVLRRISPERLVDFVMRRVKPLMGIEEILHVDMSIEVELDDE